MSLSRTQSSVLLYKLWDALSRIFNMLMIKLSRGEVIILGWWQNISETMLEVSYYTSVIKKLIKAKLKSVNKIKNYNFRFGLEIPDCKIIVQTLTQRFNLIQMQLILVLTFDVK